MFDMRKKIGHLIIQRHVYCIGYLINMKKKMLSVLRHLSPGPLFLLIALRAQSFIMWLLISAETMADVLF